MTAFTMNINLSPSKLNLYLECSRCFWLQENEVAHRPSGIPPVLHTTFDGLIKDYFDKYREQDKLPPEIDGKVEGKLLSDEDLLKKWRYWKTGLFYEDEKINARLQGALDDCLVTDDGFYIPLDYKTKGGKFLKDDAHKWHQHQLDIYTLFLESNGYKTKGIAYLVFFNAVELKEGVLVKFNVTPREVETSIENAKKLFETAVNLLQGKTPPRHSQCQYCSWGTEIADLD